VIKATDIPASTIFYGRVGMNTEKAICLRTFAGIVNMENPRQTWTDTPSNGFKAIVVEEYEEVDGFLDVYPKRD